MKIVFFGTSEVAIESLEILRKNFDLPLVITTPDVKIGRKQILTPSPVALAAKSMQIPVSKPSKIKNQSFLDQLKKIQADLFVVISYGKILPEKLINIPKYKTINVHFSKLPKYRGASPMQFSLLNGDTETAISIFVLDKGLDTGDIIWQEPVAIDHTENFQELSKKLSKISAKILPDIIKNYCEGKLIPKKQEENLATNTKIFTKEDGKIDFQKTADEIYNQFRAFHLWPGIWTITEQKVLKITSCLPSPEKASPELQPGTVLTNGKVVCGKRTVLQLLKITEAGKKEMPIKDYLNGHKYFVGSRLT